MGQHRTIQKLAYPATLLRVPDMSRFLLRRLQLFVALAYLSGSAVTGDAGYTTVLPAPTRGRPSLTTMPSEVGSSTSTFVTASGLRSTQFDALSPASPYAFAVRVTYDNCTQSNYQTSPIACSRGHIAPNHAIASKSGRKADTMSIVCLHSKTLNQQTCEAFEKQVALVYSRQRKLLATCPVAKSTPCRSSRP